MRFNNKFVVAFALLFCAWFSAPAEIIRNGDAIEIIVQNQPQFSGTFTVSSLGTIDYPLLIDEPISEITTGELARDLTLRIAKFVDNPLVTVQILDYPPIRATVLGAVQSPGVKELYRGASVQEALAAAGGPAERADLSRVKLVRKEVPDHAAIFIDMEKFIHAGNLDETPTLKDGDRIVVLASERSTKIKMIGAVNKPGFYELEEKMNIFEIIYLAGGPAEKADLTRVRRLFKHEGKTMEEVVNIQKYIDDGTMEQIPLVEEGDVLIVYSKWFDWKTLLTVMNNALLFIVTIQAFSGVFK